MLPLILIYQIIIPTTEAAIPDACAKMGGRIKAAIRKEGDKKDTEDRLCVFGKTVISEKTLQRELNHEKTVAINQLMKSDFGKNHKNQKPTTSEQLINAENPASRNCRSQGGTLLRMKDYLGEFSLCRFNDYSGIEEWAFFRGKNDQSNKILLKKLRRPSK